MSEKRCKTCGHWGMMTEDSRCVMVTGDGCLVTTGFCTSPCTPNLSGGCMLPTPHHFGCIYWQQREPDLREQLAAYAHEAWSGWMEHLFSVSVPHEHGSVKIFRGRAARWKRQSETKYEDLPEEEKRPDRFEADRMIAIFEKWQQKRELK